MIYMLSDRKGKITTYATIENVHKALFDLITGKKEVDVKDNYVSLQNESELAMEIYPRTIILQDYGRFGYDGPGGPGELLRVRYKEGSLVTVIEEAVNLLADDEREKLIKLLKTLPKP